MTADIHELLLAVVSTGGLAKIAVMLSRSLPPPPAQCTFWCRWAYDFVKMAGDNPDQIGATEGGNTAHSGLDASAGQVVK